MKRSRTMFRIIFICLILRVDVRAEDQLRRTPREIGGSRRCEFDEIKSDYNATDLLECIDELAVDFADRESDGSASGKSPWDGSTGRQISFMDIFSSFFDRLPGKPHQTDSFAYPTSGQRPSNYPSGTAGLSPGFRLNLLEALSTISRHDDYKCVPRILCEMASGKLPGRSLGGRGSGFFEFLGRNVFTDWLAKLDVAGASPLLNFGRAMILGYGNRGNSAACYDAFPRCPRNANALVHYLNNYNGGFFRLFSRFQGGKFRRYNGAPGQRVEVKERVVTGNSNDYSQKETPTWNKIQFPSKYHQYYKDFEYPSDDEIRGGNEIIFPGRDFDNEDPSNYVQSNDIPDSSVRQYNIPFFPRDRGGRKFSGFRFPSDYELTSTAD